MGSTSILSREISNVSVRRPSPAAKNTLYKLIEKRPRWALPERVHFSAFSTSTLHFQLRVNMPTDLPTLSPDQLAAHDLLTELRTRIATQPLPYQHGVESRALESLRDLFALTRKAIKEHPGCSTFASIASRMLNVDLRPVTAKWHKGRVEGLLNSKDGANEFRADLAKLQLKVRSFASILQEMAYGSAQPTDDLTPDVMTKEEIDRCFEPLHFGIDRSLTGYIRNARCINLAEATDIALRRARYSIT